jgi:hypothetical protein
MYRRDFLVAAGAAAVVPFIPRILRGSVRHAPVLAELKSSDVVWAAQTSCGAYRKFGRALKYPKFKPAIHVFMYANVGHEVFTSTPTMPFRFEQMPCVCADFYHRSFKLDSLGDLQTFYGPQDPSRIPVSLEHLDVHWTPEIAIDHLVNRDKIRPSMRTYLQRLAKVAVNAPKGDRPLDMIELLKG